MKIFIVFYAFDYMATNRVNKPIVGAFETLADAQKCYIKTFVIPFFRTHKMEDYFKFNALNSTSKKEWDDILSTFYQSGSIESVNLK